MSKKWLCRCGYKFASLGKLESHLRGRKHQIWMDHGLDKFPCRECGVCPVNSKWATCKACRESLIKDGRCTYPKCMNPTDGSFCSYHRGKNAESVRKYERRKKAETTRAK